MSRFQTPRTCCLFCAILLVVGPAALTGGEARADRLRVIIETDAGGDPDDEQSLVRFLVYVNEWDVEGIIANREMARDGENLNAERTGLGIVRAMVKAYGECHPNLVQHDPRFPTQEQLLARTVAGYDDTDDGVKLIIDAVDRKDPRPIWFCNWGTDNGCAVSCLKRALDRVLAERGPEGYAKFKNRLRLSSDDQFGEHTSTLEPPWKLWLDTFEPEQVRRRWYHRFSALTARAGGFDIERDVRAGHGPLGAMYPTNTTHDQKEGDTMTFLYLVPTGMNDPNLPGWGSWSGRYGPRETFPGKPYFWANEQDTWSGATHRENSLARWAVHLQNDFRARMDWCVKPFAEANHAPVAIVNGMDGLEVLRIDARAGTDLKLDAGESSDPDGDQLTYELIYYPEAGSYGGDVAIRGSDSPAPVVEIPADAAEKEIHLILSVTDDGTPPLTRYRRVVVRGR